MNGAVQAFITFLVAYILSQFYRSFLAVIAPELARELSLDPQALGNLQAWWIATMRRALMDASGLSSAELTLLVYERRGLATKHIAGITGTSTSSVDSRFQRINAKLDAPNRKAAAQLAAEYGLI